MTRSYSFETTFNPGKTFNSPIQWTQVYKNCSCHTENFVYNATHPHGSRLSSGKLSKVRNE